MFSLLVQHKDGSWAYHPGSTFDTPEEVEECFKETFGSWDEESAKIPHMTFEHEEPLYQKYSTFTTDFKIFQFAGIIYWPKELEGKMINDL